MNSTRLHRLFFSAPDLCVVHSVSNNCDTLSDVFYKMFPWASKQGAGRTWTRDWKKFNFPAWVSFTCVLIFVLYSCSSVLYFRLVVLFLCPSLLFCISVLYFCPLFLISVSALYFCPVFLSRIPVFELCPILLSSISVFCPGLLSCISYTFVKEKPTTHTSHSASPYPRLT